MWNASSKAKRETVTFHRLGYWVSLQHRHMYAYSFEACLER
jgi:hypothetical protein